MRRLLNSRKVSGSFTWSYPPQKKLQVCQALVYGKVGSTLQQFAPATEVRQRVLGILSSFKMFNSHFQQQHPDYADFVLYFAADPEKPNSFLTVQADVASFK